MNGCVVHGMSLFGSHNKSVTASSRPGRQRRYEVNLFECVVRSARLVCVCVLWWVVSSRVCDVCVLRLV